MYINYLANRLNPAELPLHELYFVDFFLLRPTHPTPGIESGVVVGWGVR